MRKVQKKRKVVTVSGTDRYGMAEPLLQKLIQELPNADKCAQYEFKEFEETGLPTRAVTKREMEDD